MYPCIRIDMRLCIPLRKRFYSCQNNSYHNHQYMCVDNLMHNYFCNHSKLCCKNTDIHSHTLMEWSFRELQK